MSETLRLTLLADRYVASLLAVTVIGFLLSTRWTDNRLAWHCGSSSVPLTRYWVALTLLAVTLYLIHRGRPYEFTALPMVFMLVTTLTAMFIKMRDFWNSGAHLLLALGGSSFLLSVWLTLEATLRLVKGRKLADLSEILGS